MSNLASDIGIVERCRWLIKKYMASSCEV